MSFRSISPYRTQLANGLTVLIHRNTSAPVVAINTYVRAGYFDETDDVVGIAHVLEHMFFKGTERRGVGEIAKETKQVGGYLNAHTIYDHTSYYTVLPSYGFADGLDIQADAYANSVINANELAKELEVIIQEVKRKDDNPGAITTETLYSMLYDHHRIRRWRMGREDGLRALTRDQVTTFYRNFYTPSNTVLVVAGDVDVDVAMKQIERLYGSLPAGDPVRSVGPVDSAPIERRYRELNGDIAQTQIALGWRTVPTLHADTPALDMTASVLSGGRASRLYRAVRERKLAGSVGAYNYSPSEVGVFVVNSESEPHTAADAARATWAQVTAVRNGEVCDDELTRSKQLFAARWARRLESIEGQASHFAEWEALGGWALGDAYYDSFMSVSTSDVTRVAQQYLVPEQTAAISYRSKNSAQLAEDVDQFHQLLERGASESLDMRAQTVVPIEWPTATAKFIREEAGVHVFHAENNIPILVTPRAGAPITYAGVYALGGASEELSGRAGLTALAARSAPKGTATLSAFQIAETSELLGGGISASVGAENFGWSISVPAANAYAAIDLLGNVIQNATFPEDVVETERSALLSDVAQLRDDMYRYPMRMLTEAAFENHPYGTPVVGTAESLRAISVDEVRVWYARKLLHASFVIAIVGDVDPQAIANKAAQAFSALAMDQRSELPTPRWSSRVVQQVESRDKAQTAIAMAFDGPKRSDTERFAAQLLATIASGLGGRFFDELRDKQSLAYTVHAFPSVYQFAGKFVSYIATSPSQEDVARNGLLREFQKLVDTPVTDEELLRAKTYTLGMHSIRQERAGAVLSDIVDAWLFGDGLHELLEFRDRVRNVSADDIQQLAKRYFNPEHRVEAVVRGKV